jgi:UDP-sugar transporter A1/2/3
LTQFVIATTFILLSVSAQGGTFLSLAQNLRSVDLNMFLWRAFQLAGIPAGLSVLQNFCKLLGYQKLQPITFNALNQTKTIFAAIFCYLMFNQKQSALQVVALGFLMMSALVMESVIKVPFTNRKKKDENSFPASYVRVTSPNKSTIPRTSTSMAATRASTFAEGRRKKRNIIQSAFATITSSSSIGFLAVLAASVMSGFGGALSQKALHAVGTLAFTAQLSFFSMVYLIISLSTGISSTDRDKIRSQGVLSGWTPYTMIPICSSAVGGILVGMVTKHAGVVRKGFALIVGLFLSGVLQNVLASSSSSSNGEIQSVTAQQWSGGVLAAISIWMHSAFVCK